MEQRKSVDDLVNGRPASAIKHVPTSTDIGIALGSAVVASGSVTPIILVIDKAVVQNAAGSTSLTSAVLQGAKDVFFRPLNLIKSVPFWMVWGVYGSTYAAANLIDVYCERSEVSEGNASIGKLVGTTAVNMSASLVKDVAFAKMFGGAKDAAATTQKVVPKSTYGIFLLRDTLTIAGGFTVPPLVSTMLRSQFNMNKNSADKVAQLVSPMGMQLVCTPLHLLALNMYNEQGVTPQQRMASVWKTCPQATLIRMFRFLGAYGIGGITNKTLLLKGRQYSTKYCPP